MNDSSITTAANHAAAKHREDDMAGEDGYDIHFLQDPGNTVPSGCECPNCEERDADNLLLDEEEDVTCQRCGTKYNIGGQYETAENQ